MPTIGDCLPRFWPKPGDRLFVQSCPTVDAEIATFGGERLYRMKKAFKTAADLLVTKTEEAPHERRNLVWPIVFCYRQYIELALKDMIEAHGSRAVPEIEPDWKHHDLQGLWKSYKRLIGLTLVEINTCDLPEVGAVEACIEEFDRIDAGSYTFRYPTDTKGKQTEIPFASIDLSHLRNMMEGLFAFLDAAEAELNAHFDSSYP
jgi:hypothetical protein